MCQGGAVEGSDCHYDVMTPEYDVIGPLIPEGSSGCDMLFASCSDISRCFYLFCFASCF